MTDTEIREEGEHVFDLALAKGIDTGRYVVRADLDDPEHSRIQRGPNYDRPPTGDEHEVWGQHEVDRQIERRTP